MTWTIPDNAYLSTRYVDHRRRLETGRVYHEDGRIEAFDGKEWWEVCRFTSSQVEAAKRAIRESGLLTAKNQPTGGVHDTAPLTYSWRLDGKSGSVTNAAYPAKQHPVFEALQSRLDALEEDASA